MAHYSLMHRKTCSTDLPKYQINLWHQIFVYAADPLYFSPLCTDLLKHFFTLIRFFNSLSNKIVSYDGGISKLWSLMFGHSVVSQVTVSCIPHLFFEQILFLYIFYRAKLFYRSHLHSFRWKLSLCWSGVCINCRYEGI